MTTERTTGRIGAASLGPTATADSFTGAEDYAISGSLLDNDIPGDGGFLFAELATSPAFGVLLGFNEYGGFLYRPNQDFFGTDSFTYRAVDGAGNASTATVTLLVTEENDAPVGLSLSATTVEENRPIGSIVGTLSATDPNGDAISYAILGPAGPFAVVGDTLRVNGPIDFEATAEFPLTLVATDAYGARTLLATTITVADVAEPPAPAPVPPDLGFGFSNGSFGAGLAQAAPSVSTGYEVSTDTVDFGGGPIARLVIENTGVWNSIKNLAGPAQGWTPDLPSVLLVSNFVDVRLNLANAPAPHPGSALEGLDVTLFGVKRGSLELGAGDDFATIWFHSNGGTFLETLVLHGGDGDDDIQGRTIAEFPAGQPNPLADNADPSNGRMWNPGYDGRYSRLEAYGGDGNDVLYVSGKVTLAASGGAGMDAMYGADGDDVLDGGAGPDLYFGGAGRDTFILRAGETDEDLIADFEGVGDADGDVILLAGYAYGTLLTELGPEGVGSRYILSMSPEGQVIGSFIAASGLVLGKDALFV